MLVQGRPDDANEAIKVNIIVGDVDGRHVHLDRLLRPSLGKIHNGDPIAQRNPIAAIPLRHAQRGRLVVPYVWPRLELDRDVGECLLR